MKLMLTPLKESYDQSRKHIKKQRHYFATKDPCSQGYGFSSGHVWMWELVYKETWALKNWLFWTFVTFVSRLDCKNQPFHPKEISPEYSLEGLMLKLKCQYFVHLMWGADLFEKTLMLGKIEGKRRRRQQRMRWLDGITDPMAMSLSKLWVLDGQGGLACCSPCGCIAWDTNEWLKWTSTFTISVMFIALYQCSFSSDIIFPSRRYSFNTNLTTSLLVMNSVCLKKSLICLNSLNFYCIVSFWQLFSKILYCCCCYYFLSTWWIWNIIYILA